MKIIGISRICGSSLYPKYYPRITISYRNKSVLTQHDVAFPRTLVTALIISQSTRGDQAKKTIINIICQRLPVFRYMIADFPLSAFLNCPLLSQMETSWTNIRCPLKTTTNTRAQKQLFSVVTCVQHMQVVVGHALKIVPVPVSGSSRPLAPTDVIGCRVPA